MWGASRARGIHEAMRAPGKAEIGRTPTPATLRQSALTKVLAKTKQQGQGVKAKGTCAKSPTHAVTQSAVAENFDYDWCVGRKTVKPRFIGLPFFVTFVLSEASGPRSEGRLASELFFIFANPLFARCRSLGCFGTTHFGTQPSWRRKGGWNGRWNGRWNCNAVAARSGARIGAKIGIGIAPKSAPRIRSRIGRWKCAEIGAGIAPKSAPELRRIRPPHRANWAVVDRLAQCGFWSI